MNEEINLDELIAKADTSRNRYEGQDIDVDQSLFVDDIFQEISKKDKEDKESAESTSKPVETEPADFYDVPEGTKYVLIEKAQFLKALSQLTPIIHLNATRAVSRGISIKSIDSDHIDIISPNELFYFKTTLEVENKLDKDEVIFIEYIFLQKMAQFIPSKVLIYSKKDDNNVDQFFIRLKVGDLELQNTYLIDADLKKLTNQYNISDEVVAELEPESFYRVVSSMSKLLKLESDSNHKQLITNNGLTTFQSALIKAGAKTTLPNNPLAPKVIDYLLKSCQLINPGSKITFYKTDSPITRYAICYDDSLVIANFADTKEDARLTDILTNLPELARIDYSSLQYQLTYASAITYAKGAIEFVYSDGVFTGNILLQNGNSAPVDIKLLEAAPFPDNTKFKLNSKALLTSFNALNPSLETKIGFKDNILYIVNDDVTLALICI